MEKTVSVFFFGKEYKVPQSLTILSALEYAGYRLTRGCGCRNGVCGACATLYRIKGEKFLKACLACQTKVEENMCVAAMPGLPLVKREYELEAIRPDAAVIRELFPEIDACVGCGLCSKHCPKGIDVAKYIDAARRGDFARCAEESFACVMCGICSSCCPKGILQPQVAMLARRIRGKVLSPACGHLEESVQKGKEQEALSLVEALLQKPLEEIKELYNHREIER